MSYRPLPSYLTIKESSLDGLGVFSKENIPIRTSIGCYSHIIIDEPYINKELQRVNFGGFINHSKTPNCVLELSKEYSNNRRKRLYYKLLTIRDIQIGEEILLDYTKELCGLTDYKDEEWMK